MGATEGLWSAARVARGAARAPRRLSGLAAREAGALLSGSAAWMARRVGEHVDLTALVAQVVDLDRLVAGVDLDAVARRLDIDAVARRLDVEAVVDRLDLVSIVESVIDEIDLPQIIRGSTGSMASDTLTGARLQGMSADEALTRIVNRLRARGRRVPAGDVPATVHP